MDDLKGSIKEIKDEFKRLYKSIIAMLVGLLMCFLTGIVGIYVNSNGPKDKYSSQAEMTMMVKALTSAIKEAKK